MLPIRAFGVALAARLVQKSYRLPVRITAESKTSINPFADPKRLPLIPWYVQSRQYSKSKDKKKSHKHVEVNEAKLRELINIDNLNSQMQKAIQLMKEDYKNNLSLRSMVGAIESLRIVMNDKEYQLQELAGISRKNPKMIIVNMMSFPQTIPEVLKAFNKSGMNLNPQQDGTTIYVPIPTVTKEHREKLNKNAKTIFIKYRDMIKGVQNNAIKKLKKSPDISEDDLHAVQAHITSIGDKYVAEIEKLLTAKQTELSLDR